MKKLKHLQLFENFDMNTEINLLVDVSGSIPEIDYENIIDYLSDKSDIINIIFYDTEIENFVKFKKGNSYPGISNINSGGGTILENAILYVIEKGLENNDTYIFTDGYSDSPNCDEINGNIYQIVTPDLEYQKLDIDNIELIVI